MIGNLGGGLVHQIFARAKRHFILVYMLYTYTHIYLYIYILQQGVHGMKTISKIEVDLTNGFRLRFDDENVDCSGITEMDIHLDVGDMNVTINKTEKYFFVRK